MALAPGSLAAISSELALRVVAHTRLAIAGVPELWLTQASGEAGPRGINRSPCAARPERWPLQHGAVAARRHFFASVLVPRFDATFTKADGSLGVVEFKNGPGAAVNPRQAAVAQDRGRRSADKLPICGRRE